jgi:hypothetical protein
MFIWNANQVGSGKTRLAQMCLYPVFGTANLATWWDRNEDMKKELDSAAQEFVPYLFFDDRSGKLQCNLLNGWATSSRWSGRVIGTKERFYVTLRAITLITGNQLTFSDDISRRARVVELFQPVQWDQRVLPKEAIDITEEWLAADENRRKLLSALWSLVKHAEQCQANRPVQPARKLPSFEGWSKVVPQICIHAKFGDPTEMPPIGQINPLLEDTRQLARRALDQFVEGKELHTVKLAELVPIARRNGYFVETLGTLDDVFRELDAGKGKWKQVEEARVSMGGVKSVEKRDPTPEDKIDQAAGWLDRATSTAFGKLLKKLMTGLQFTDSAGRLYQFGAREGSRQAMYVCRRIKVCEPQLSST